ncbi:MAG TPA: SET domain-containing protein-lysine N-methyltransferase [Bryobacteraceae bacterium]|nr:SET domain-containing protein-lysine N-methyltransferase [Bryobacteraceae bacterium]
MARTAASMNGHASSSNGRPKIDERYACFKLRLGYSKIHRWGVYAAERIPARRKVIEYTGEKINRRETKRRADASDMIYLFTLDPYWTLDGAVGGSGAQYINHCCEPNLTARIVKGHIIYVTLRDIAAGEELTVDYHFDKKVERVPCRCGAEKCRGTINLV